MTALIVEDDNEFAGLVQKVLEPLTKAEICDRVTKAIDQLAQSAIEVVFLDINLPDSDGLKLARFVQNMDTKPVIVLMTAHADKQSAIDSVNLGVFRYLEKPFSIDQLTSVYREASAEFSRRAHAPTVPSREEGATGIDGLKLHAAKLMVEVGGSSVQLTETEFRLLSQLLGAKAWISRKDLEQLVWGEVEVSRNLLDTHLSNLKKKIPFLRNRLVNVRGHGYVIERGADGESVR